MSVQEFTQGINNFKFFSDTHQTINDIVLDKYEIEMINTAQKNQDTCFGGVINRNLEQFNGSSLVVGGGKSLGQYGENQGKTLLYDVKQETQKIDKHIELLLSQNFTNDPHTGFPFSSEISKAKFIDNLIRKKILYKKYYELRNEEILSRYFTINIDATMNPDIIGSITCLSDTAAIPDNKFTRIEFENVPCDVFLIPSLYTILERITKPKGKITLSINNACRRIIIPVIAKTKFGEQYSHALQQEYKRLEQLHPTYHRISIDIINN
ncbi:MAG: hypothetical protein AB8B66_04205 [Rickettsiaceae bacterium]